MAKPATKKPEPKKPEPKKPATKKPEPKKPEPKKPATKKPEPKPATKKPEPKKPEPKKPEPKKPATKKPEPKKPEPKKPATKKPEPKPATKKPEPKKPEPNKPEPKKPEPNKKPEPKKPEPKKPEPKKPEPKKPEPTEVESPRIEARLVFGDVSVPVDPSSLEATIGAGKHGYGRGLMDKWPDAAWVTLLSHAGSPADPLDRETARPLMQRLVQRLWWEAVTPWVLKTEDGQPTESAVRYAKRDAEAATAYATAYADVKENKSERAERAKSGFGRTGGVVHYEPTAKAKAKAFAPKGQAGILLAAFKASKWASMTTEEAAKAMVTAGLKTSTKPERIAAFYLCQWAKNELVKRVTA
jgi:hypothetical protein